LSEAELAPSVRQLLTEIFNLGLFENPYVDPAKAQQIANSAASQAVADEAHRQSIVLLRNNADLLPLESPVRLYVEVFTAGNGAATQTAALKALFANDPLVTIVSDVTQANAALVWLYPAEQELAQEVTSISDPPPASTSLGSSRSKQRCRRSWWSTSRTHGRSTQSNPLLRR
jgi:beta-glucosidase